MITAFYAGILGMVFILLSIDTIKGRRKYQISLGYGPNNEIEAIVSAHANFVAYTPFFLILMILTELSNLVPSILLHLIAIIFTVGRMLHYLAFRRERMKFKWRILGMHLTLWPLLLLAVVSAGLAVVVGLGLLPS